ncbi:nucleotidyl transferase AbiEii/AbiGii toxin family protein [Flavobacterium sp.]|uniref:nucleotidyl transferase AbiEii/AbiGii toxin family protein n=1 Tax=Flavobacterium sp. TaxID=239 RepID=UPI003D09DD37
MNNNNNTLRELKAYEAFIRRASEINLPFMLKGSYVTRQYFKNPSDRIPADLDWIYLEPLENEKIAKEKFNEWATLVTELQLDDNIQYRSFRENEFWRMIDYAMADDFPTVNTDLRCTIDGQVLDFTMDISFNLPIEQPPVPIMYTPLEGKPFLIPCTAPISLQVSWKIHQTLVRPRFKDLFDLIHLVQHPSFDSVNLEKSFQALINECIADNVDFNKIKYFLNYDLNKLFPNNKIEEAWKYWRHNNNNYDYRDILYYERANDITDETKLPSKLNDFITIFKNHMIKAGFDLHLLEKLPSKPIKHETTQKETQDKIYQNTSFDKPTSNTSFWTTIKKLISKMMI